MNIDALKKAVHDVHGRYILDYLSNCGVSRDEYEIEQEEVVNVKQVKQEIEPNTSFYYYDGPFDSKTRPFCQALLRMNKFWGQVDLNILSAKLGYDVFLYEGGFNCRHVWKRARIKGKIQEGILPETPSRGAIDRAAVKQPTNLQDYLG